VYQDDVFKREAKEAGSFEQAIQQEGVAVYVRYPYQLNLQKGDEVGAIETTRGVHDFCSAIAKE